MNRTLVVARKEIKELLKNKGILLTALGLALFFSIFTSVAVSKGRESASVVSLNSSVFYLSAMVGLFIAYMSTSQIFLREKADRVIETLLCAPVNLRQIWLGKVLGVSVPAYLLSLLTVLLITVISGILSSSLLVPTTSILVHVLLVLPTLIAAFTGLLGFVQFRLGMRESRILNFVIFAPLFAGLYGAGYVMGGSFAVSWTQVGILFGISALLLAVTAYLTKRLSKERIVTTLP